MLDNHISFYPVQLNHAQRGIPSSSSSAIFSPPPSSSSLLPPHWLQGDITLPSRSALCLIIGENTKEQLLRPFVLSISSLLTNCKNYDGWILIAPTTLYILHKILQITAHEAKTIGLVTEVFPDVSFQQEVWPKLQAMAKLPSKSLMYSKALTRDFEKDILHKVSCYFSGKVYKTI